MNLVKSKNIHKNCRVLALIANSKCVKTVVQNLIKTLISFLDTFIINLSRAQAARAFSVFRVPEFLAGAVDRVIQEVAPSSTVLVAMNLHKDVDGLLGF